MSLAENLLNSLPEDGSTSRLAGLGEEPHIIVDENRRITIPEKLKLIAVEDDKNVETVTFDCVRYWDGNDLSTFTIYLNYTLPDGRDGTHMPTDIKVFDDHYSFTWTIDKPVTDNEGNIQISVMARLIDNNANVLKQWSSFVNNELTIVKGLYISYLEGEDEEEQDFLSQILSEIRNKPSIVGAVLEEVTDYIPTIISFTIDGEDYQAESGMTWSEWVNSSYNTGGFKKYGDTVYNKNDGQLYDGDLSVGNGNDVLVSAVIPQGSKYYSTIQFTIQYSHNTPYIANFYMTWGMWVDSDYNTDGYVINDSYGVIQPANSNSVAVKDETNTDYVYYTDRIETNVTYIVGSY